MIDCNPSGARHSLSEGLHEFNFSFTLPSAPSSVATSFEGRFGSVRYFVRADLHQSWAFTHRAKRPFTVISPVDINTEELRVRLF